MNTTFIKITITILLCTLTNCTLQTNAKTAIEKASASGKYLCLIFHTTENSSLAGLLSNIATFKTSSHKKIAVYKANLSNLTNRGISDKFGVNESALPMLFVIAPNGAIAGSTSKTVNSEQLNEFFSTSDLTLKVRKALQDRHVALVALQNLSTMFNTESWQAVSDFASDPNIGPFITAIKADPMATENQGFIRHCELITPLTEATVVILSPPGIDAKILNGKITKADISKYLPTCSPRGGGGCCSDRRYKKNISPITSALDKVTKLQGVSFNWDRTDFPDRYFPDGRKIGLIAQNVETVIPEVVRTDKNGFKSVEYDKLTAVLVEAMKEMKTKMNYQDSIIKVQCAQIKALEAKR